jgi:hypothetical protein
VADANIAGHVARLVQRLQQDDWREFWEHLELQLLTFTDLGLDSADSDAVVWERCQQYPALLLTNNRNDEGPESLETSIQTQNTVESLPVFCDSGSRSDSY